MRALFYFGCLLLLTGQSLGFATPTSLAHQVKKASAVLRVVVISTTEVEDGSEFQALARCRIISKYKGGEHLRDFVYIPIDWPDDPQPAIEIGGDYIITLEVLKSVAIAHPICWDAAHEISGGKIFYTKLSNQQVLTIAEFERILRDLLGLKKDNDEPRVK